MKLDLDFFQHLPKAELHCHLDGSLRVPTVIELATQQKVDLPTKDPTALHGMMSIGERLGTLESYLDLFNLPLSQMKSVLIS